MPTAIRERYDVAVLGGGPGGIGAAVAAARNGARTLLIEQQGFLGGAATAMLVYPFMPHWAAVKTWGRPIRPVVGGIYQEILARLEAAGGLSGPGETASVLFDDELLKIVLDDLTDEAGVEVVFHATLTGVHTAGQGDNRRIDSIEIYHKGGRETIEAAVFVDSTGDADLAALAGVPAQIGRAGDGSCQPMTLNFRLGGVAPDAPIESALNTLLAETLAGRTDCILPNLLLTTARFLRDPHIVHFNATRILGPDATRGRALSAAEREGRRQVRWLTEFLRNEIPGYASAYLLKMAAHVGVRETRRIEGEYELSERDVLGCARFDDAIACGAYCIDIHNPEGGGTRLEHLPPGEFYQIPYRCLIPRGVTNLLIGSRSISATHEAHSSLRIMPIVCALGQAAGTAAALAVRDECAARDISIVDMQTLLRRQGAILE